MQGAKTQLMPRRRFGPLRVNTRICCLLADCSTPLCSRPQILPISTAYAVCEGLGLESGLDKTFAEAPIFYWLYTALIVAGAAVLLLAAFPARVRDGAVSSREWDGAAVRADLHVAPDE